MIISLKTNIAFKYITMSSLREEIVQEMEHPRVDKNRLFALLLKIVDNAGAGGIGPMGPPGPVGPSGPQGERGPTSERSPASEPKQVTKTTPSPVKKKKVVA
jgi:hypothetical protein